MANRRRHRSSDDAGWGGRVAYITTRFPIITQTFVFREILELIRTGWEVELHAFARTRLPSDVHPEAAALTRRCVFPSLFMVLRANAGWVRRRPRTYAEIWRFTVRGCWRDPWLMLRSVAVVAVAAGFARNIEAKQIRHIHAHWATEPALAAYVCARLTGASYSFTTHAHDFQLHRVLLREKAEHATAVVTVSETNRGRLKPLMSPATRIDVIHCGVDLAAFPHRPAAPPSPPVVIVNVAALKDYKGQAHLVEAVALLRGRGYDVVANIIGEGPLAGDVSRYAARLGISSSVRLRGVRSGAALVDELVQAHVFAMPSVELPSGLTEGIPVAVMEAMAVGVPVVASDVSGMHELVVDGVTGLLVRPGNAAELADGIARLIDQPEVAADLSRDAWQRVAEQFDVRQTTQQLAELFNAALGQGRSERSAAEGRSDVR